MGSKLEDASLEPGVPGGDGDRLVFRFSALETGELIVVTDRAGLQESIGQTVAEFSARLVPALEPFGIGSP